MERLFTRAEAEALLPLLSELLSSLRDRLGELEAARAELAALPETARRNGQALAAQRLEARAAGLVEAARGLVDSVQALGVEIKDPRTGLVDFRAERDGRVVYLCWRLGEPRLAHWHELDAGFAGRQPLDEGAGG